MEYCRQEPQWLTDAKQAPYLRLRVFENHNLDAYSGLIDQFKDQIKDFVECGADSAVFEMNDGNILKFSYKSLKRFHGKRSFDLPMLEKGKLKTEVNGKPVTAYWHIQPKAEVCKTNKEFEKFNKKLQGHKFIDFSLGQIGSYNGEMKLLDYYAVVASE
jgi:hypothetical protein